MILDLRGNGGGSLMEAVMLTALFVRPNPGPCPVVQIRETRNLYVLPTFPDQPTFAYRKPLVVLIDRHSASASEIVAGALQDTGRAVIVGDTQSHGKGTVQTVLPMGRQEYGSMKITTARFYRINGSSTQVKGVASDICLPSSARTSARTSCRTRCPGRASSRRTTRRSGTCRTSFRGCATAPPRARPTLPNGSAAARW